MPLTADEQRLARRLRDEGIGTRGIAARLSEASGTPVSRDAIRRLLGNVATGQEAPEDAPVASPQASPLRESIMAALAKGPLTVDALCDLAHEGPTAVKAALGEMAAAGLPVREAADGWRLDRTPTPTESEYRTEEQPDRLRVGFVSDTHLCSKAQNLEALNRVYDVLAAAGVRRVLHHGDILDGFGVYRGQEFEVLACACDEQVEYGAEHYPQRDGMETDFITGNHDLAWMKRGGHDPGPQLAALRPDLHYLGRYSAWVELAKGVWHYMLHPDKGGAYALSYKPQRMVEAWTRRPQIANFGHWHQCGYFQVHGVHALLAGCFQRQTEYMRRLGLEPQIGAWLIDLEFDGPRIVRFRPEWVAG